MKIKKLILTNFMRYKGTHELEFSCDEKKNVTVVVGDNTFGKTTLAQAFRWGLYGSIINTQYERNNEVCLLNYDILSEMDANSREDISVEIQLIHDNTEYAIKRIQNYIRKFPQMVGVATNEKLKIVMKDSTTGGTDTKEGREAIDIIQELFPKDLSQYFFFDGERWREDKNKAIDIKTSVHNLMGLSAVKSMMLHIKELGNGRSSVIGNFKGRMKGDSGEEDLISKKIEDLYNKIEKAKNSIIECEKNVISYEEKIQEINGILENNKRTEEDQREVIRLQKHIERSKNYLDDYTRDIISGFSSSYKVFATPLLEKIIDILKEVDVKGKDIPFLRAETIEHLVKEGVCICGCDLSKGSSGYEKIMHLMDCVPPVTIGMLVSKYEEKLRNWKYETEDLKESILDKCRAYQSEHDELLDKEYEVDRLNQKIDKKINFANERARLNNATREHATNLAKIEAYKNNIEQYMQQIKIEETKLENIQSQNEKNEIFLRDIAYAEALYEECKAIFQKNEMIIINDLNKLIKKNFAQMFNEREKSAALDSNYDIKLFYKSFIDGKEMSVEATGLSEGEKIARNFVFIVSIMELAKEKKADTTFSTQELPIVLDGPFSKLSAINTELISSVLPEISEQVIVFTLDKDWQHTKLDEFIGIKYVVEKNNAEVSSSLKRVI